MVACTFLLGEAMARAYPEIYNVSHFGTKSFQRRVAREQERSMRAMQRSVPMVFLAADGTVTPVRFMDKDGNAVEERRGGGNNHSSSSSSSSSSSGNQQESGEGSEGKFGPEDKDDEEGAPLRQDPDDVPLEECLVVEFQGRQVPVALATLPSANEDGWTVLHACSHQAVMSEAAREIILVLKQGGHSLDDKTRRGPGSYATGWTALHIACAYGVTATARELIAAGANVNTTNSAGWTPLFEAVHRGYAEVCEALLAAGARVDQLIPPNMIAPYHAQLPLAHAARSGHVAVARALLAAGADKDAANEGGWTALHEAVFFRNEDIVALLLEHGVDLSRKTGQGYTALHFESSAPIAARLKDAAKLNFDGLLGSEEPGPAGDKPQGRAAATAAAAPAESKSDEAAQSYRLLGQLPDFKPKQTLSAPAAASDEPEDQHVREERKKRIEERKRQRKARREQDKLKQVELSGVPTPEPGVPQEYACQLTGKLLSDPVTTVYGNHFERSAIVAWLKSQGNLCPVTGQPLGESDCVVDKDLRIEINDWQLRRAMSKAKPDSSDDAGPENAEDDLSSDLYEF